MRWLTGPIVANLYRRTSDGRTLFCPWGGLGRAYIVPPEREAELTNFVGRLWVLMIATIGILTPLIHWWTIALAPVFIGLWYFKYWAFSRTLEVDPAPPPPVHRRQLLENQARAIGAGTLWFFLVIAVLFVAIGLWMRSTGKGEGTFVALFFGLCAVVFIAQLVMLRRR